MERLERKYEGLKSVQFNFLVNELENTTQEMVDLKGQMADTGLQVRKIEAELDNTVRRL